CAGPGCPGKYVGLIRCGKGTRRSATDLTPRRTKHMRHLRTTPLLICALLLFTLAAPTVSAANFTFSGNFTRDDSLLTLNFLVTTPGAVQILTTSYTSGGFSPVLSLFDQQLNNLLIGRDNGVDHPNGEANLTQTLGAGSYFLVLSQFDNLAAGPR